MADSPEVADAKAKLRKLVVPAVDKLEELMDSEHAGIRLGAAKEVLDRGGVPARSEQHTIVDIGLDAEIEELIGAVRRQVEGRKSVEDYLSPDIEDAELVEDDQHELSVGEQAGAQIGIPKDDITAETEEVSDEEAWWQSRPK